MDYINVLCAVGGVLVGLGAYHLHKKYRDVADTVNTLLDKVDMLHEQISNSEEIAKKILTMKMPVSSLPPDIQEQIKEEADKLKTASTGAGMSYMG